MSTTSTPPKREEVSSKLIKMKGIAIDVDGTITDEKRHLSLEAVKELRKAIESGYKLVLCTGNIACFARSTAILIGTDDPVIAENGGVIETKDGEKIVLGDKEESEGAFSELRNKMEVERFYEDRFTEVVLDNDIDVARAREAVSGYEVDVVDTGFALHIKPKNTDKGKALKEVCSLMGLDEKDFLAIGDSVNDIELLETAGLGVAVGNSAEELKEVADVFVEEKNGLGVVKALSDCLDHE